MKKTESDIAHKIDHTILKADSTKNQIEKLCAEAREYNFAAVCIPPYFVKDAARFLSDCPVKVCTVIGFPLGFATTAAKVEEIKRAVAEGADELDVVINIAAVKDKNWNRISSDINSCMSAAHMRGKVIKVILETSLLTDEEIIQACQICTEQHVDYVKTSTGTQGGASIRAVELLRSSLPDNIKVKASGGIRDTETAQRMIAAGADRIGTSSGVAIVSSTTEL